MPTVMAPSKTFRPALLRLFHSRFGLAVLSLVIFTAAWSALHVDHGLRAEYFASSDWTGSIQRSGIDSELSEAQITKRWGGAVPAQLSIQWSGFLQVPTKGLYRFSVASEDGARLSLDGIPIVDNAGGPRTTVGALLNGGSHYVILRYAQRGGAFAFAWKWARGAGDLHPVPLWLLTPASHSYARLIAGRVVGWLWWASVLAVVFFCPRRLWEPPFLIVQRPAARRPAVACLLLFAALAVLETWPLATNPAHLSRNDNADAQLNEWIMAWDAHQVLTDPRHLFDANIFYPARDTLAYSESLLVQAAMGAPLLWLGASPVLTYNLVLLAGFALTGWAMCFLIARWTHDWIAGIASGLFAAFNAQAFTRLPHMQIQHVEFFPLALLALDRLLREPRVRHAIWLAVWYVLQALTSVYLLVFVGVALVVATLARADDWLRPRGWRFWGYAALAALVSGAVLLPFLWPYWLAFHDQSMSRPLAEVAAYAANWRDYLTTPATLDYSWWGYTYFDSAGLFPGWIALALAAVAVVTGVAFRDGRARMCLAFGVCGVMLSFGPRLPGYDLLYRFVPLFRAIRMSARFGYLEIAAVAVLAGFGFAWLRRRPLSTNVRGVASAVVLAAALAETLVIPIHYADFDHIPRIYDQVRGIPHTVVAEFPFYSSSSFFRNGTYLLDSTRNWQPMLNGYSGFVAPVYHDYVASLSDFPNPSSVNALERYGVTDIFVRLNAYSPEQIAVLDHDRHLRRIALDTRDAIALYALDRTARTFK